MKLKPHEYQEYVSKLIIEKPKLMAVLEMGLGKTLITLMAIDNLINNHLEVKRVLIIGPLRVVEATWPDEIEKWGFDKTLKVSKILGTEKQRIDGLNTDSDIYLINRENVKWLIDHCASIRKWKFDMMVIDESSSFKSQKSQRFKALRKVAAITKRVVLLTGTPMSNGYMDLWSQIYLLDQGEKLGKTITSYRDKFFTPEKMNGHIVYSWKLKEFSESAITGLISDKVFSLKSLDYIKMPERIDNFIKLKMSSALKKQYRELERNAVLEIDESLITGSTAAVVVNKLLQLSNGAVYQEDGKWLKVHDLKLDALEEYIDDNEGKPILVFYNYLHDLERIKMRFAKLNPRELKRAEDIKEWNDKKVLLLLAHPASAGHGLNLQAGGNIIIWFGPVWSLELYLQANARLYRQGQKETVVINHLIVEDTYDEKVIEKLRDKKANQDTMIESVKALIRKYKEEK